MIRYSEEYWMQRLDVNEWVAALRKDPVRTLNSQRTLWRLEELHALAVHATDAVRVTQNTLAQILKKHGFKRASAFGVRTMNGQVRLWRIGGPHLPPTRTGKKYDEENGAC